MNKQKIDTNRDVKTDDRDNEPKIRKITIKTAVRAAGQSHNRYKVG